MSARRRAVRAAMLAAALPWAAAAAAAEMKSYRDVTIRNIERAIAERKIEKLERLLALLPEDVRSSFTMAYESRSVQGASPEFPRVIMFRPDGRLALTFNGDPAQAGYDRLEIMEFSDGTGSFRLQEIEFRGDAPAGGETFVDRGANPPRCAGCHSDDPHPIWANYYVWRGMYGSKDDFPTGDEAKNLKKFVAAAAANGRYRWLIFREDENRLHYLEREWREFPEEPKMKNRPNARLGMQLAKLNAIRLAGALARSPAVARRKYAVLHRLLRCAPPVAARGAAFAARVSSASACLGPAFEKEPLRALMEAAGLDGRRYLMNMLPEELAKREVPPGRDSIQRALAFFDGAAGEDDFSEMVALRLAKSWLGDAFQEGRPAAEAALYDPAHGGEPVADAQEKRDLAFLADDRYDELRDPDAACAEVAARGEKEAASSRDAACEPAAPAAIVDARVRAAAVLRGCVSCHQGAAGRAAGYSDGPAIPFGDEALLGERLRSDPALLGRVAQRLDARDGDAKLMPLFGPALTKDQRDDVMAYLNSLAPDEDGRDRDQ